jgi:hypothetical protein
VSRAELLELEIATEVRRLVERLSQLTAPRLAAPAPPYPSRAAAAHALAQRFVDVTAAIEDHSPTPRLPWVDELTAADQLAVTANDFRYSLAARPNIPATLAADLADLLAEVRRVRAAVR